MNAHCTPTPPPATKRLVILLVSLAALLWVAIEAIGSTIPGHPSPYQVVWVRYVTHLLLLLLVWGPRRGMALVKTNRLLPQIGRGMLMFGMPVCFVLAAHRLPVNTIWATFWLTPLATMLVAMVLLRERTAWPVWLATVAAAVGVWLILQPVSRSAGRALLFPLGMAACFGLYLISSACLRAENILASLFYTAVGALLPLSVALPRFWRPLTWVSASEMALIGLLGLLLLYCLDRALEVGSIGLVAPFLLSAPLWSLGIEQLLHAVPMAPMMWWGSAVVLCALASLLFYQSTTDTPIFG